MKKDDVKGITYIGGYIFFFYNDDRCAVLGRGSGNRGFDFRMGNFNTQLRRNYICFLRLVTNKA